MKSRTGWCKKIKLFVPGVSAADGRQKFQSGLRFDAEIALRLRNERNSVDLLRRSWQCHRQGTFSPLL